MDKFYRACNLIIKYCPNEYAKAYARAGLTIGIDDIETQKLYILSNLSHWRGETATEVKSLLKEVGESK